MKLSEPKYFKSNQIEESSKDTSQYPFSDSLFMEFFKLSTFKFTVFTFCFGGSSGLSFEEPCSQDVKQP